MRTLKELIPLIIGTLVHRNTFFNQGLCLIINSLRKDEIITFEEYVYLKKEFISLAKPKWYMFRYYCKDGIYANRNCKERAYYWNPTNKQVRIEWLEKQLSKQ